MTDTTQPDTAVGGDGARPDYDPVAHIASLLDDTGANIPQPETEDEEAEEDGAEDGDTTEAETETEDAGEEDGAEEEAEQDEADEDDGDEPAEPAIDPPASMSAEERERFAKLPRDAQEWIVSREKSLTSDYTRKTQEIADNRKKVQSELSEVQQKRQQYADNLEYLEQRISTALSSGLSDADMQRLYQENPAEWARQNELRRQAREQLNAFKSERQRIQAEQRAEHERLVRESLQEGAKRLPEMIPEWRDAETAKREKRDLTEFLLGQAGFTREEVASAADPRIVALARKAMLYDRMSKATADKTAVAKKKVAAAPKAVKPTAQPKKPRDDQRAADARKRLAKSGRVDDAASYIASLGIV